MIAGGEMMYVERDLGRYLLRNLLRLLLLPILVITLMPDRSVTVSNQYPAEFDSNHRPG